MHHFEDYKITGAHKRLGRHGDSGRLAEKHSPTRSQMTQCVLIFEESNPLSISPLILSQPKVNCSAKSGQQAIHHHTAVRTAVRTAEAATARTGADADDESGRVG